MQSYELKIKDDQWQKLEPLLIGRPGDPGISANNSRLFIEAVLWIVLRDAAWNALPLHFGKSGTLYMRFRRWNECDFWRDLANNPHMDGESRFLLQQIVHYGDAYTARIKERKARGQRKIIYTSMLNVAMGEVINKVSSKRTSREIDESTLHWVSLVASQECH